MASSVAQSIEPRASDFVFESDLIEPVDIPRWKRMFDVVAAAAAIIGLSPIIVVIGAFVMLDSPGGAIYRQTRVGRGGKCFTCWKFRTMRRGADQQLDGLLSRNESNEFVFKMREDPRRTRVGKFLRRTSLDELPQLWNVLRGDMSIVGPRPPTISEVIRYDQHHLQRLMATPGITGLWQVTLRGRRHEFADMVDLDVRYAREMSLGLDLKILLTTVPTVLFGRGSY